MKSNICRTITEYVFEFWKACGTNSVADSRTAPATTALLDRRARSGSDSVYSRYFATAAAPGSDGGSLSCLESSGIGEVSFI